MFSCPAHNLFFVWHWLTIFGTWVYHYKRMCRVHSWPLNDLDLWPQYQNYIFTMNLCLASSPLLFDIELPNVGIWVYHYETTCCVHSWPLYDLDLWPICGRLGASFLVSFDWQFLSCSIFLAFIICPLSVLWKESLFISQ